MTPNKSLDLILTISDRLRLNAYFAALYKCSIEENTTADFGCRMRAIDVEDGGNIVYSIVNASDVSHCYIGK